MTRTTPLLALALFAFACGPADNDGDGFNSSVDCNDDDALIFPGAPEICDAKDNDCDGNTDEQAVDAGIFFLDEDGDLHGTTKESLRACNPPEGFVPDASDCNDADPEANPSAVELCNLKDDNCNGIIDDSPEDAPLWYADADKDGWGSNTLVVKDCEGPEGYITVAGDCNDFDFYINPVALEYCDHVDNDCDGDVDEPDAEDHRVFYKDADGDGYGDSDVENSARDACWLPDGYSENADDCNDDPDGDEEQGVPAGHLQNPGLEEICRNGYDDNCDDDGNQCWYSSWESSEDATRFLNGQSGDYTSYSMQPAGDVDGDGIQDFLIGAYYGSSENGRTGTASLFYGRVDEDFSEDDDKLKTKDMPTWYGAKDYDYFGRAVSAGELNADKTSDLVIGSYGAEPEGGSSDGSVYIVYGNTKRFPNEQMDATDGTNPVFFGENRSDYLGFGLQVVPSVGTDKVDDLLIGAPYYDYDGAYSSGAVYLIPGVNGAKYEGVNSLEDKARFIATERYYYLGYEADSIDAGDINGDSRADIFLGAYGADSYAGAVYMWYGTGVDPKGEIKVDTADETISGTRYLGRSIKVVDDLNDDGYDDLVLGEYYANSYAGACYVMFGGAGGVSSKVSSADVTIKGPPNGYLCYGAADSGDLNNDGTPELVMGAYYARDGSNQAIGAYYILEAGAAMPTGDLDATSDLDGEIMGAMSTYSYFGRQTDVFDYNNDGYDDVFVGAYSAASIAVFDGTDW